MGYKRRGSNSLPNKAAFPTHMCYKGRPHLSLVFPVLCCVNVVYTVAIFYKKNEMLLWVCVFVSVTTGERGCGGSRVEVRRHWHFFGILWSPATMSRCGNGVCISCTARPSYEDTASVGMESQNRKIRMAQVARGLEDQSIPKPLPWAATTSTTPGYL